MIKISSSPKNDLFFRLFRAVGVKNHILFRNISAVSQYEARHIKTSPKVQWNLYQTTVLMESDISTKKGVCSTSQEKFSRKDLFFRTVLFFRRKTSDLG